MYLSSSRLRGFKRKPEDPSISMAASPTTSPYFCEICHVRASSESLLKVHFDGENHKERLDRKINKSEQEAQGAEEKNISDFKFWCNLCDAAFSSSDGLEDHLRGEDHRSKESTMVEEEEEEEKNDLYCDLCDKSFSSNVMMDEHLKGKKHKMKARSKESMIIEEEEEEEKEKKDLYCDLCDKSFTSKVVMYDHLEGKKHKAKAAARDDRELMCEVCGVPCTSEYAMASHLRGKKHKREEARLGMKIKPKAFVLQTATEQKSNCEEEEEKKKEEEGGGAEEKGNGEKKKLWCEICSLQCNSEVVLASHLNGMKHRSKKAKLDTIRQQTEDIGQGEEKKPEISNGNANHLKENGSGNYGANYLGGKRHEEEEKKEQLWCLRCKVSLASKAMLLAHLKGTSHKSQAALPQGRPIS